MSAFEQCVKCCKPINPSTCITYHVEIEDGIVQEQKFCQSLHCCPVDKNYIDGERGYEYGDNNWKPVVDLKDTWLKCEWKLPIDTQLKLCLPTNGDMGNIVSIICSYIPFGFFRIGRVSRREWTRIQLLVNMSIRVFIVHDIRGRDMNNEQHTECKGSVFEEDLQVEEEWNTVVDIYLSNPHTVRKALQTSVVKLFEAEWEDASNSLEWFVPMVTKPDQDRETIKD